MEDTTGVLLLAYGGPENQAEIEPFLQQLLRMDKIPGPLLQRVVEKYQTIGGGSPLPRICRGIRKKLAEVFADSNSKLPVYLAFRYSKPDIDTVVKQMAAEGIKQILAVSLSPHASKISTTAYFNTLDKVATALSLEVVPVQNWYRNPRYIDCLAGRVTLAASQNSMNLSAPDTALVFSVHNIPESYLEQGDLYVEQIKENMALLMEKFPHSRHFLGYQSKGKSPGAWLKPEIDQLLPELIDDGLKKIILIPLSFAMDHLETLYDIDQEIIPAVVDRRQIDLVRVTMCNDDDDFIRMLFNNISSYIQ
ncbi:MAG: ferrochelatase [Deltaproteobacteria bacterium]|nr:ferrochelatase [Candidatus Tharpellaceae bacterium]